VKKEIDLLCSINCKFLSEVKENSVSDFDFLSAQFLLELFAQVTGKKSYVTGSKHQFMQY